MDKDVIRCVTFNSDATKLFCGCEDGRVLLLSVEGDLYTTESTLGKELWRCDALLRNFGSVLRGRQILLLRR